MSEETAPEQSERGGLVGWWQRQSLEIRLILLLCLPGSGLGVGSVFYLPQRLEATAAQARENAKEIRTIKEMMAAKDARQEEARELLTRIDERLIALTKLVDQMNRRNAGTNRFE